MRTIAILAAGLLSVIAWAQSTTTDTSSTSTLQDNTPQENARAGAVSNRAPGTWVRQAIVRHSEWIDVRVDGPRAGIAAGENQPDDPTIESAGGGTTSSSSGATGTTDLSNLLGSLTGGGSLDSLLNLAGGTLSSGGLGDLTSLLGGLTGATSTGTSTGTSTDTSTSGSSMTLEDLLALRDALAAANGGSSKLRTTGLVQAATTGATKRSTYQTRNGYTFGGAIARLPKPEDRLQSTTDTTTETRSFRARLLDAWASTFFTAMSVGFQSDFFVSAIKNAIRPLFPILDNSNANENGNTNQNTNANANSNSSNANANANSNTNDSGDVEDLEPPNANANTNDNSSNSNANDNSGSVI